MDSGKISESQKEDRHLRLQSDILSELLLVAVSCVIEYDAALSVVGAVRATATIWATVWGPGKCSSESLFGGVDYSSLLTLY